MVGVDKSRPRIARMRERNGQDRIVGDREGVLGQAQADAFGTGAVERAEQAQHRSGDRRRQVLSLIRLLRVYLLVPVDVADVIAAGEEVTECSEKVVDQLV